MFSLFRTKPIVLLSLAAALGIGFVIAADPQTGHGDGSPDATTALKTVAQEQGLKIEIFAGENLLANPVSFATDEKGRWFIAESYRQEGRRVDGKPIGGGVMDNRNHMKWLDDDIASKSTDERLAMMRKFFPDPEVFKANFETHEERIVRIDDSDGDGKADRQTILADGFREALDGTGAGVIARGNEVWWTCIPSLWRFADADDDGKAEVKDRMLTGFGVKFAFRGHDMHGLRFGPDGKLYFSIGDRGINVQNKEGQAVENTETGSIMRCNPDGTQFEVFATGVRNPQELAFDELGNLFTGDNNSDAGDKARFVQLVESGDCGWRMSFQYLDDRGPWNRELLWDDKKGIAARYIIQPIANIGNGPSGLTYNPGTGLSGKYAGQFFMSDFRGGAAASVVHQIRLKPSGAWFELQERKDLVKGILTPDVEFGVDGNLYVLDWVADWSGVDKGRIFKITDSAAVKEKQDEVKKLLAEGFGAKPDEELERLLAHEDQRIRQGAQFALAAKPAKPAKPVLINAAQKGPNMLARIHGIWGLGQIAAAHADVFPVIAALLADPEPEVRAQAARVLGDHKHTNADGPLVNLLKDPHPRARFYAALALGKSHHKPAIDNLVAMLAENADKDPIIRHGAVMGLTGCADGNDLAARATDSSVAVRGGLVVALRRQKSPQVAVFLKDSDPGVVLEAARAIYDVPIAEALPPLAALIADRKITDRNTLLRVINAHYRLGTAENAQALVAYAADPAAPEVGRKEALEALSAWANPNSKDRLTYLWRPLPERTKDHAVAALQPVFANFFPESPAGVQIEAAECAAKLGMTSAADVLLAAVSNVQANKTVRYASLRALAVFNDPRLAQAAKAALADSDPKLTGEALKTLVTSDPETALKTIVEILESPAGIKEKQGAIAALTNSKTPEAEQLLSALLDNLLQDKLPLEVQLDVFEASKKRVNLVPKVQEWRDKAAKEGDAMKNFTLSLAGGDWARGKKVFRDKIEVQCFRCHKCEDGDSVVGPDLTKIGAEKDRLYILESIVFPNKHIAQGFQIVVLELNDGKTVAGRLVSEKDGQLQVESLDDKGKPQVVPVAANTVKTRTSAPSPMPEAIRDQLTRFELRDLVEYLATRK